MWTQGSDLSAGIKENHSAGAQEEATTRSREREAMATALILRHPERSDRGIAVATGLPASRVAVLRKRAATMRDQPTARIGRDGRVRPLDTSTGRRLAEQLLRERPTASLREIAAEAGISPGTVRDVRNRLNRGEDAVPDRRSRTAAPQRRTVGEAVAAPVQDDRHGAFHALCQDPSLRLKETGRQLLRWLACQQSAFADSPTMVNGLPPHAAPLLAAVARGWADDWLRLASRLEAATEDS
jgi:hypothetical protein